MLVFILSFFVFCACQGGFFLSLWICGLTELSKFYFILVYLLPCLVSFAGSPGPYRVT